ncbi:MAG: hypothetical protein ACRYF2_15530 [Janthinobacterium lividum]
MPALHFITHPEVVIDPSIPVPDWPLSSQGIKRMMVAVEQPWMHELSSVFSSAERKAIEAARIVRDKFGLSPIVIAELGENDRSTTGYLPKAEFEATADLIFARLEESVRGCKRRMRVLIRYRNKRAAFRLASDRGLANES